jgi:hypothetical protein
MRPGTILTATLFLAAVFPSAAQRNAADPRRWPHIL